jgi:hypothetical protein
VSNDRIRVLYIGGFGRSGSTLLERTLSRAEGFCAVGELRHVWERGVAANQLCGCGVAFRECDFWCRVLQEAFGGLGRLEAEHVVKLKGGVDRTRYIPSMLLGAPDAFRRRLAEYTTILARLYRAIRDVSGCRVIVDSSKEPSHGYILRALAEVDLFTIHLVRDSRAVAYSWLKKKQRPEIYWTHELMARYTPFGSSLRWLVFNGLMHGFPRAGGRYLRLHYEQFARDPAGVVARVLDFLGEPPPASPFIRGHTLALGVDHTASGNPMRFAAGEIRVKPDDAWREKLAVADRRLVTACTWPLLLAYGYARGSERAVARQGITPAGV